ncbi:MAG TPA: TIGR04282 family arsenosugar biosynthesis glycosyltransferase [Candidatus Binataceae bacterium]|nr:TIGR04282 family arsenosugar biosynthesis glycosyltransferase [Candidatus Binataceae bacterium]
MTRFARHLVVFTRKPRLGTGKRRLARDIGEVGALRFQRVMLSLILRRLGSDRRWLIWLAVTPDRSGPWPQRFRTLPQGQGNLGHRMAAVARNLPPGPIVIIGSDIPGIAKSDIARAFHELGWRDAVFGPATDGGYWLVGLRRRPRFFDPFVNVRWSSEHALGDTLANLAEKNVALLRSLSDVDDGAALARHPNWGVLHDHRRG